MNKDRFGYTYIVSRKNTSFFDFCRNELKLHWVNCGIHYIYCMQPTKEFIVERLQEILAIEATKYFQTTPLHQDFKQYLAKITKVVDWEDDFVNEVYQIYLQKISETGYQLTNTISQQ